MCMIDDYRHDCHGYHSYHGYCQNRSQPHGTHMFQSWVNRSCKGEGLQVQLSLARRLQREDGELVISHALTQKVWLCSCINGYMIWEKCCSPKRPLQRRSSPIVCRYKDASSGEGYVCTVHKWTQYGTICGLTNVQQTSIMTLYPRCTLNPAIEQVNTN